VLTKTSFSCCEAPGFLGTLDRERRPQVVLCGMEGHVCVLQTALELHELGWQVFVVEDAVCSRSPVHQGNALERMRQAGVIATNTESVLFEWLRDASHSQFRAVSALVK
jgi:nicotinamidase-related amidase